MLTRRRVLALTTLNHYGEMYSTLQETFAENARLKQLYAESRWREIQLFKRAGHDAAETVWTDFTLNQLDPDFSFADHLEP